MNKNSIVLISKDATLPSYFGPYGAKFSKTPNIDELAKKGTVFLKHYSAAPSTAMAFLAMFTGLYPYETPFDHYYEVEEFKGETIFNILENRGYKCHIIWSRNYNQMAYKYTKCYGKNTVFHDQVYFNQACGFNAEHKKKNRTRDEDEATHYFKYVTNEIESIDNNEKVFLWIHMPHCIKGRISYGDDIDIFDSIVGVLRDKFGDDSIFITADHGHMNGQKGKTGYGFDVYENAVHIPLITPRINDESEISFNTSNTQLIEIMLNRSVSKKDFIVSECAYYAQKNRKTAILKDEFFYIYNKKTKKNELYDMEFDPNQNIDLSKNPLYYDKDRKCKNDLRQLVLYDKWDEINAKIKEFEDIRRSFWKNGTFFQEFKISLHKFLASHYGRFKRLFKKK